MAPGNMTQRQLRILQGAAAISILLGVSVLFLGGPILLADPDPLGIILVGLLGVGTLGLITFLLMPSVIERWLSVTYD